MIRSISVAISGFVSGFDAAETIGVFVSARCVPKSLRHLHLVATSDEVDIHDPRNLVQEMVMEG